MEACIFLSSEELTLLTGRKLKRKQIEALKQMSIPFYVNATGQAIVTRSVFEVNKAQVPLSPSRWESAVLQRV